MGRHVDVTIAPLLIHSHSHRTYTRNYGARYTVHIVTVQLTPHISPSIALPCHTYAVHPSCAPISSTFSCIGVSFAKVDSSLTTAFTSFVLAPSPFSLIRSAFITADRTHALVRRGDSLSFSFSLTLFAAAMPTSTPSTLAAASVT
mmetsp:Transcript_11924/g.32247  ORF Transcript_11924/g.32247 Transcript_11924/m.32247 type:complete len:146 (-) Transcript_11924:2346-2783(-)